MRTDAEITAALVHVDGALALVTEALKSMHGVEDENARNALATIRDVLLWAQGEGSVFEGILQCYAQLAEIPRCG